MTFLAVEGIDASGKSTLARALADRLGGTLLDRRTAGAAADGWAAAHLAGLRRLIWEYPPGVATSQLGFGHWSRLLGAWFAAVDAVVLRPALDRGGVVVADSWWPKFAARFAVTVGPAAAAAVFDGVSAPDAVVWLDVPPEVAVRRRTELRGTEDGEWTGTPGFLAYQGQVREAYAALAAAHGWLRVPAGPPGDVLAEAVDRLEEGL